MAGKAARPEHPGDKRDKAAPADETQPQFREALERKRAKEAGTHGAPRAKGAGKIHGAQGPAMGRRSFRRKSG